MISRLIPTVHRLFPFTFGIFVIAFCLPTGFAHAETVVYDHAIWTTSTNDSQINQVSNPNFSVAVQVFTPTSDITFDEFGMMAYLAGDTGSTETGLSGTASIEIWSSADGLNADSLLYTSSAVSATDFVGDISTFPPSGVPFDTAGPLWHKFDFSGDITLTAGQHYIFKMKGASFMAQDLGNPSGATNIRIHFTADYGSAGQDSHWWRSGISSFEDHPLISQLVSGAVMPLDTTTHIETIDPSDGGTIATSSLPYTFETTGYVNPSDYQPGARLRIKVDRNTDAQSVGALTAFGSAFGNYTYLSIHAATDFDVSTTTIANTFGVDRVGLYRMTQDIQVPGIGVHWWIFNFDITYNTLFSKNSSFTVGTTTAVDNIQLQQEGYLTEVASSTGDILATCQFSWFSAAVDFSLGGDLIHCLGGLAQWAFWPSTASLSTTMDQIRVGLLNRFPWGYGTRLVSIISTPTASSSLPVWTAPLYFTGTSTPDDTLTFDPGDMLDGAASLVGSIKANGTNLNIQDIFEPIVRLIVALFVVLIIFHDIMSMGRHTRK